MESSEIFLLAWAFIATVLAIYFQHRSSRLRFKLFLFEIGVKLIGEGKAKVVIDNDTIRIVEV